MNKLRTMLYYLLTFLLLYRPFYILKLDSNITLVMIVGFMLVFDILHGGKYIIQFIKYKYVFVLLIGISLSAIYCAIAVAINSTTPSSIVDLRIIQHIFVILYLFASLFIINGLKYNGYDKKKMIEFLLNVAVIQGVICLIMLVFPSTRAVAINSFVNSTIFNEGDYILRTRVYGLGDSYTYGIPIINGLLTGLCFYHSTNNNKKYYLALPFIFLVSVLNGRTGILIGLLSIFLLVLFAKFSKKITALCFAIGIIALFIVFVNTIKIINPSMYDFIGQLFSFKNTRTFNYLTDTALFFPSGWHLIFGTGMRVYGELGLSTIGTASDIGYVNYIFLGGILYLLLYMGSFMRYVNSVFKKEKKFNSYRYVIIISTLIACWKGEIFNNLNFIFYIFIICSIFLVNDRKEMKLKENDI